MKHVLWLTVTRGTGCFDYNPPEEAIVHDQTINNTLRVRCSYDVRARLLWTVSCIDGQWIVTSGNEVANCRNQQLPSTIGNPPVTSAFSDSSLMSNLPFYLSVFSHQVPKYSASTVLWIVLFVVAAESAVELSHVNQSVSGKRSLTGSNRRKFWQKSPTYSKSQSIYAGFNKKWIRQRNLGGNRWNVTAMDTTEHLS